MKVLLFGSSPMAAEYLKVLKFLNCHVTVIGRNQKKAQALAKSFGFNGMGGGVKALKSVDVKSIDYVINAAAIDSLTEVNLACLKAGIKNILIEKPGALNIRQLQKVKKASVGKAKIHIAFNRRFYNSVLKLQECLKHDGRIEGCFFDFTDREKDILNNTWSKEAVSRRGWTNSAHVIDLAFFLIGNPTKIQALQSGSIKGVVPKTAFVGCGQAKKCLFSYFATWAGGGRWNLEVSTPQGRYKLSPIEELKFCKKNQFEWETLALNDDDDTRFKPGLLKMVRAVVVEGNPQRLPDLAAHIKFGQTIKRIFGYAA